MSGNKPFTVGEADWPSRSILACSEVRPSVVSDGLPRGLQHLASESAGPDPPGCRPDHRRAGEGVAHPMQALMAINAIDADTMDDRHHVRFFRCGVESHVRQNRSKRRWPRHRGGHTRGPVEERDDEPRTGAWGRSKYSWAASFLDWPRSSEHAQWRRGNQASKLMGLRVRAAAAVSSSR